MHFTYSLFPGKVVCFLQPLRTEGTCNMTNMTCNAYYRYFSFTFFWVRLGSVWLEGVRM